MTRRHLPTAMRAVLDDAVLRQDLGGTRHRASRVSSTGTCRPRTHARLSKPQSPGERGGVDGDARSGSTRENCSAPQPVSADTSASCSRDGRAAPTPGRGSSCSTRPSRCPRRLRPAPKCALLPGGRGTSWEQLGLRAAVNRDAPDVFFAPAYTAPLGLKMPFAVTIHDVSFSANPAWFRWREGLRRRWLTRRAARHGAARLHGFGVLAIRDREALRAAVVAHRGDLSRLHARAPIRAHHASGLRSSRDRCSIAGGCRI